VRPVARITLKVAAVAGAVIGVALMFAQDQETLMVRSPVAASDPAFLGHVADLTGHSVTRGDRYDLLVNGDQIYPAMLQAIRDAERRISFETYIYSAGRVAAEFTKALADAARRGVEVRTIVDAIGGSDIQDSHVRTLREAGVRVGWFNPAHWYSLEELNYRTHRKILVVDGRIGFTGGVGVADQWLGNAQDPGHWRDTHVRVSGPVVRLLEAGFYENWIETAGEVKPALDPPPPAESTARSLVVWSSPTGGSNGIKLLYLLAVAGAERTLDITSPYFVMDESVRWTIGEAVKRGVKIRLVTEGEITDARPVKYASRAAYEWLLAQGVEIYEYQGTMMHAKSLVVDGIWSIVGSSNFDNRSLELNDELNVGVWDAGVASRLLADFETDRQRSRRLDPDAWRRRPALDKLRERIWSFFGELF
jgi:cardiolipin synthase